MSGTVDGLMLCCIMLLVNMCACPHRRWYHNNMAPSNQEHPTIATNEECTKLLLVLFLLTKSSLGFCACMLYISIAVHWKVTRAQ
jgi:hypothetical protein